MKVLFLMLAMLSWSWTSTAQQAPPRPSDACASMVPYGQPRFLRAGLTPICRQGYMLMHDNHAKIARWAAYRLTPDMTLGCEVRNNVFTADQSLPRGQRAEPVDYANSGYDTGHIVNAADMSLNQETLRESFILSNMAPQLAALNRGAWKQLETAVRAWAHEREAGLIIYVGSIYDQNSRRIGPNSVVVPDAFYKIVIDVSAKQTLAFLFPHTDVDDFRSTQTTVRQIEHQTGIRFPIPDNRLKMNQIWYVRHSNLQNARRASCGRG